MGQDGAPSTGGAKGHKGHPKTCFIFTTRPRRVEIAPPLPVSPRETTSAMVRGSAFLESAQELPGPRKTMATLLRRSPMELAQGQRSAMAGGAALMDSAQELQGSSLRATVKWKLLDQNAMSI